MKPTLSERSCISMQYIVLDLEWNQPTSYNSTAYKSVGEKLLFELIQIGAVKMNERLEIVDSFSQMIRPVHYAKLHPRIKRITHITQEELDEAPEFVEALERFAAFCGEDYALLTWGCDDVSVLDQNMRFFKCDVKLGQMYDMQQLFGALIGNTKERKGLKAAMEQMKIDPNEEMPFHNALNDAYYTALVFAKMACPEKVLQYPLAPKKLRHVERRKEQQAVLRMRGSVKTSLAAPAAMRPPCPVCGQHMAVPEGYVRMKDDVYTALADCPQHGLVMVSCQFGKDENGKKIMTRTASVAEEQNKAYVATKHLQWKNKLAAQQGEA